ncbi:MAG: glycosyltransferase family 39 protein [Dokdonella sp.]
MREHSFSTGLPRQFSWQVLAIAGGWLVINALLFWLYFQGHAKTLIGDEAMYDAVALAQLQGQTISLNFIWPPGQKWFLMALHALTGPGRIGILVVQTGLLALCGWLLYRLWLLLDNRVAALWACALFLINPGVLAYAHWLWPEVPHLACFLAALLLLADREHSTWPRALAAGALIGAALLFKSLLAAFWPFMVLLFLVRWQGRRSVIAWKSVAAFVIGMFVITAPSLLQGWRETGRPMIADSSIYNLYVGLIDKSRSDYIDEWGMTTLTPFLESGSTPQERNAVYADKVDALLTERGFFATVAEQLGRQYFRLFNAKGLLVSQLPGPACAGYLGAYADSSLAAPLDWVTRALHGLLLTLAAIGIATWRRWRNPLAIGIVLFFGYQLALYLGLHVMQRYLFPFLPFLCGFAGSALAGWTLRRGEADSALIFTRWRLMLAALLATLLLGFAYLGPMLDGPRC